MRVIAGTAKSRRLATPKSDRIRPVLDQVKEAIFNILFNVEGADVLDLFAGTGAVGLEALSRGARFAVFVDNLPEAVRLIRENTGRCGFEESTLVLPLSAAKGIEKLSARGKSFDLIFVDPPYLKRAVVKTLRKLAASPLLREKTRIVVEHHPKEPIPEIPGLSLTDQRKYGQTVISFLGKTPC